MNQLKPLFIFGLVGIAGLAVDSAILLALNGWLGPYVARLFSFAAAVLTTWVLNRRFTFSTRQSGVGLWYELGRYFVAMLGGGAVNYATYAALVAGTAMVARWPVLGVVAGSLAGMGVNFTLARLFVFAQPADPVHEQEAPSEAAAKR